MFSYTINKNADNKVFKQICTLIENNIRSVTTIELIEDVDGSQIQIFDTAEGKIRVYNDYMVDAVYVDSELDLKEFM